MNTESTSGRFPHFRVRYDPFLRLPCLPHAWRAIQLFPFGDERGKAQAAAPSGIIEAGIRGVGFGSAAEPRPRRWWRCCVRLKRPEDDRSDGRGPSDGADRLTSARAPPYRCPSSPSSAPWGASILSIRRWLIGWAACAPGCWGRRMERLLGR